MWNFGSDLAPVGQNNSQKESAMTTGKRVFWLLSMIMFLGGCSTYQVVSTPKFEEESPESNNSLSSFKKGDQVRITQWYDGIIEGKVIAAEASGITIKPIKSDSEELLHIEAISIKAVEKMSFNVGKSLLVFGIVALPIVALGIAIDSSGSFDVGMMD